MTGTEHTFGGSALDSRLFDFETVADASAATTGAPAEGGPSQTAPAADPAAGVTQGGEPDPSAGVTEAAPAWTPEQIAALRSDPEFQSFLSEEAATVADARFEQLLEQTRGQTPTGADTAVGGEVNLNEYLDPYGENFGTNLTTVLGNVLQRVEQSLDQRFQPINAQAEQVQQAGHDELLTTAITDTAAGLGGLRGGDAAVQRVMAAVRTQFMPEAARVYGNTDRAAQVAIDRAIRAERDYQNAIAGGSAVDNVAHLATIAGARGDLAGAGSGSGLVTLPNEPLSTRERVAKYAPQMQPVRTA